MFIVDSLAQFLLMAITVYTWIVIVSAIMTFMEPNPYNKFVQILFRLTQPAYVLIKRYIPTVFNGIDIAPIVLLLILHLVKSMILHMVIL